MGVTALRTVTDRFSIIGNIRKYTAHNSRRYILNAIRATLETQEVTERIKLGECFGFYGHTNRALYHRETGSLNLPETCTVTIDGKPIVLHSVPSNRTLEISVDDDGIVTHTQEILDTDPGHIVDSMDRSQAGGWSWATGGNDQTNSGGPAWVQSYNGMDYVTNPNYISLNRQSAMLESVGDVTAWRLSTLKNAGYSDGGALAVMEHFDKMHLQDLMTESTQRATQQESELFFMQGRILELQESVQAQQAILESATSTKNRRLAMLDVAEKVLPVFMSEKQKRALLNMESDQDLKDIVAMFESINGGGLNSLPLGNKDSFTPAPSASREQKIGEVSVLMPQGASFL